MKKSFFAIIGMALILAIPFGAIAAEEKVNWDAENVYHATGENGLTGLYYTTSPYTTGSGISVNLHTVSSTASSITVTPVSVTLGFGKNTEISAATRLYSGGGISALGDTDFYVKFKFRSQGEAMPALALALGVTVPTSTDVAASDISVTSGKVMLIGGGETNVSDTLVVGLYFNLTAHMDDPGQATENNYMSSSFGLMVPISDNQKLQGFLEYRTIRDKTAVTLSGENGTIRMVGLRYAARFLKITGGLVTPEVGTGSRIIAGVAIEI